MDLDSYASHDCDAPSMGDECNGGIITIIPMNNTAPSLDMANELPLVLDSYGHLGGGIRGNGKWCMGSQKIGMKLTLP